MTQSSLVRPAYCNYPAYTKTLGPEVCDLAKMVGMPPEPEQEEALNILFAISPDDPEKSAAFEYALICARQNMKTSVFEMAALGWLFITDQQLVVWSAHEMDTTRRAFEHIAFLIEDCPVLSKRLEPGASHGIYRGNGNEKIMLAPTKINPEGQELKFKARTHGGGRGLTGNKVVLDEAMFLESHHLSSLIPTLSTVRDPQVVYGSSAGLAKSSALRKVRDRGRAGNERRLAYIEYCAPENICADENCTHVLEAEGCALDDIEVIRLANPMLERRITIEYVRDERKTLSADPEEYGRERAGWWSKPDGETEPLISAEMWSKLLDSKSEIVGNVSFGVYVNISRTSSAIGVAGYRADGKYHFGIVPAVRGKKIDSLPGTIWIPERLKELHESWGPCPVVIYAPSSAAALVRSIEQAGVDVTPISTPDLAKSCGKILESIEEDNARHMGATPLARSMTAAKKRELQDYWVWDLKDRSADISQTMAITLALHGLVPGYNLLDSVW